MIVLSTIKHAYSNIWRWLELTSIVLSVLMISLWITLNTDQFVMDFNKDADDFTTEEVVIEFRRLGELYGYYIKVCAFNSL
jgi:hypothetical protein